MTSPASALKILGSGVLSLYGDKTCLAPALRTAIKSEVSSATTDRSLVVPDFDVREVLGKKGTRSFDRHTGLFVANAASALAEAGLSQEEIAATGIINGTATGSLSSIQDFLLDTWRLEKPYFVNPAHMPNTVINVAAGQCAIWHGMKGPNATISAGAQSFHASVRLACRWARLGYASHFLVGAVEEVTSTIQDLRTIYARQHSHAPPLCEAAAAFVVEAVDPLQASLDEDLILGVEAGTSFSDTAGAVLRAAQRLLSGSRLEDSDIAWVAPKSGDGAAGRKAEQAMCRAFARATASATDVFGNTYSASGALQLIMLLGVLRPGQYGLAVSASGNGSYAVMLLRKGASSWPS